MLVNQQLYFISFLVPLNTSFTSPGGLERRKDEAIFTLSSTEMLLITFIKKDKEKKNLKNKSASRDCQFDWVSFETRGDLNKSVLTASFNN